MRFINLYFVSLLFIFSSSICAQSKKTLAVLEMDAEGISASEVRIISDRLRTALVKTGHFIVLERDKMNSVLQEQGFQQGGCVSDECVVEMGKLIGTQLMVAGSIGKIGQLYTFNVRIIDVESGRVLRTAIDDCRCPIEDVLTSSTDKIAQLLIGNESAIEQKELKKAAQNSRFYFSPFLGYGSEDSEKLGVGGKFGYQTSEGFLLGTEVIFHLGTDESTEVTNYAGNTFILGEFGYIFRFKKFSLLTSLVAGYYNFYEEYYDPLDFENAYDIEESGMCGGINLGAEYHISNAIAIGIDLKLINGFEGDGDGSIAVPYATFNFFF